MTWWWICTKAVPPILKDAVRECVPDISKSEKVRSRTFASMMISARRPTVDKLTGLKAAKVPRIVDEDIGKDNRRPFFPVGNTGMEGIRLNLIDIHCTKFSYTGISEPDRQIRAKSIRNFGGSSFRGIRYRRAEDCVGHRCDP